MAAARAEALRSGRRRRALVVAVSTVVAVAAVGGVAATALRGGDGTDPAAAQQRSTGTGTGGDTAGPPWPVPADPSDGVEAAGLDASTMEGTATHFHSHLDILVDGRKVTVPANIGIDTTTGAMSELHSHDTSGVLHVESPSTGKTYTLGQLFTEWGVRLDARHLGGLTAEGTTSLTAWVDGTRVGGDPADVRLTPHRQIALVYGPTDAKVDVPSTYRFSPGE